MEFRKATPQFSGHDSAYEVVVDGQVVGTVESRTEATYRKHGRIRYPTGRAKYWGVNGEHFVYRRRQDAAELLLREWRDGQH